MTIFFARQCRATLRRLAGAMAALCLLVAEASAATLSFAVNVSEPVTVTGTPRIAIDVGGITRSASYAAGSGTSALTFAYQVQPGDFDPDGISIDTPRIDLDGGTITDVAGNPLSSLGFTAPDTSALKVQTYTASFTSTSNPAAVSFAIAKAPLDASFSYAITSSGGAGAVTGSGTITASPHTVSGVDVSKLPAGTLTLSVTVATADGAGQPRTASFTPAFTGVLDGLPAVEMAYSVRRLCSAYAGPLLRVRRSSDNAQQDIPATVAGDLDTASLTSFCGANSCDIRTWYDQSGYARNAGSSTTANPNTPWIVTAGALETEGGRPAIRYTASGQLLDAPALSGQTVQGTMNAVARVTDTSQQRHVVGDRGGGVNGNGRAMRALSGGGGYFGFNSGGATVTLPGSTLQQRVITLLSGTSGMAGALDGSPATGGASSYYLSSGYKVQIGGGGAAQSSGVWIGTISEVTIFNLTLGTAYRQALERSQGSYFGIAVQ